MSDSREPLREKLRILLSAGPNDIVIDAAIDLVLAWANFRPIQGQFDLGQIGSIQANGGLGVSGSESVSPDIRTSHSLIRNRYNIMRRPAEFDRFWDRWPKKVAKVPAIKAWIKIGPDDQLVKMIHLALDWQIDVFAQRDPDKVPHPATWLNKRRWEDERPGNPALSWAARSSK